MSEIRKSYEKLCKNFEEIRYLDSISELLCWDQETMLAENGFDARGAQSEIVARITHEKRTNPEIGTLLEAIEPHAAEGEFSPFEQANIRSCRRDYDKETKIPASLAGKFAELQARGYGAWLRARKEGGLEAFCPVLKEIVDAWKERARCFSPTGDASAYDICLDAHEPGIMQSRVDEIFAQVKASIIPFAKKISESKWPYSHPRSSPTWNFDREKQKTIWKEISTDMGFDYTRGRLDLSVHPFTCGVHRSDVRLTSRFIDGEIFDGIYSVVHECGHGLYEQGLPVDFCNQPVGQPLGMATHESQSLFWERLIGQSRWFCHRVTPRINELFGTEPYGAAVTATPSADDWYAAVNKVQPTLKRLDADELTYHAHILVRYEIERDLMSGRLPVEAGPIRQTWEKYMREYVGLVPDNDVDGALQDVHWGTTSIGYFPSYSLGALVAIQLFEKMRTEMPDLEEVVSNPARSLVPIRDWLCEKVHSRGKLDGNLDELLIKATGETLNPTYAINYYKKKYTELYGL